MLQFMRDQYDNLKMKPCTREGGRVVSCDDGLSRMLLNVECTKAPAS